jgi:tRNA threonylcarbamoyladenosine biosynthesis protein TsaB
MDTCDSRGSVAVLRDDEVLALAEHRTAEEYSSWLLPTVGEVLRQAGTGMTDLDGYAMASGPGSFTGVRLGLTTAKAWAEVYGRPIAAVSRLEAIASQASAAALYVAAFADAQRGQVFGGVYRRNSEGLQPVGEEVVTAPGEFIGWAAETTQGRKIWWASPDAAQLLAEAAWKDREKKGETIKMVSATLAAVIGRLGARRLAAGRPTDVLALDANYVRRSDAEIFWKGGKVHGAETKSPRAGLAIRVCRPEDAEEVAKVLRESSEAAKWSVESLRELFGSVGTVALVREEAEHVTGFIIGRQVLDQAEILNLAVTPAWRRKGQGVALLGAVLEKFARWGVSRVFLEVRESNELGIAFYSKRGFTKTGRRPGYYREPDEAAMVMEKKLTG